MAMNAVRVYFNRNCRRQDMMSSASISQHARTALKMVYLTLFCAMSAVAFGSHLHLIWEARGLFTVLCFEAGLLCLYFITPPWRVTNSFLPFASVLLLAILSTISLKSMNESFLLSSIFVRVFQCLAIVFGVLIETLPLMRMWFNDTPWMLKVHVLLAFFMVYLMIYSQEILYHAQFGDIVYVNCTFIVFFCLPAIVVYAARHKCVRTLRRRGRINRRHFYIVNKRLSR